jgi:hypothetical protein
MAKIHGPSVSRATFVYAAGLGAWLWSRTPSGQVGHPPHAALALMVVAMVAGPVALVNFWNIMWGSLKADRSVPMFLLETVYSVLIPGAYFGWHILHYIR